MDSCAMNKAKNYTDEELRFLKNVGFRIQFFRYHLPAVLIVNGYHGVKYAGVLQSIRADINVIDGILQDCPHDLKLHIQCW